MCVCSFVVTYREEVETPYVRFRSSARIGCVLLVAASSVTGLVQRAGAATGKSGSGYWSTDSAGVVSTIGDAASFGDLQGVRLRAPVSGIAGAPGGQGYWLVARDGGVFAFGSAGFHGSAANLVLNGPVVGIAATGSGRGYWLAAGDGGVFTYGYATFFGSAGNLHLNAPVVGIASVGSDGYRLAASDGGVFTYGDATFFGSAGNLHLNAPVVGIASVGSDGYRLAASDGGVFTYGGATFSGVNRGSTAAIATSPFGGYVLQYSGGGTTKAFGSASSCSTEAPPPFDSTRPRFVGVAAAFDRTDPRVVEGALATVSCLPPAVLGGDTGEFHAPARWRVDFGVNDAADVVPCSVRVASLDGSITPPQQSGSIQMRRTQMAGHSVFDVGVFGFDCWAVASTSFFVVQSLPFTTTAQGDTAVFSSLSPIAIQAHGTCTTEVRADNDGRLVERKMGQSYTMQVPGGTYWLSNSSSCTVSVS